MGRSKALKKNMARYDNDDQDWDHDEDWGDDSDDDGTIPCPYCGESMLEAADYCPSCDRWITDETPGGRKSLPTWAIVLIVILLLVFLFSAIAPF